MTGANRAQQDAWNGESGHRWVADVAEATDYLADTGIARAVLDTIAPTERDEAIAAVTDVLEAHANAGGVRLDAGINLIRASR